MIACQNQEAPATEKKTERTVEEVLEHYPDGKKRMEGKLVNGERHGNWKVYYENGFLWSEGKYWKGKRKGYSVVYHKNGKKKLEGNYEDDVKVGIWKLWGEDGSLYKSIDMDNMSNRDSLK